MLSVVSREGVFLFCCLFFSFKRNSLFSLKNNVRTFPKNAFETLKGRILDNSEFFTSSQTHP